jgi:23S rRNA pseudouridine1911/1915/1917 synthase
MPEESWGWQINEREIESWILDRADGVLVVNKPAGVVCHPSKHGPWSSLVGAAREYLRVERIHMPFRLDRETSGVMLLTGDEEMGRRLQGAVQRGAYSKEYVALLTGELRSRTVVALPIGHAGTLVRLKRACPRDGQGQAAVTVFEPLCATPEGTLVRVLPQTGRLHQIRVHARAIGHPLFGDKIYGPDESLFVEFIESGWTPRHESLLGLRRQALHCSAVRFHAETIKGKQRIAAPLAPDLVEFCKRRLKFSPLDYLLLA